METSNIIITVGRQLGSGGKEIASLLAQHLGYKMYDGELLNLAAKESGLCERLFERNDEQKVFSKSFFRYNLPLIGGEHGMFQNELSQDTLFKFQSEAIIKAAEADNCVFVGRCADYILRDAPRIVSFFVTANLEEPSFTKATNAELPITISIRVRRGDMGSRTTFASILPS